MAISVPYGSLIERLNDNEALIAKLNKQLAEAPKGALNTGGAVGGLVVHLVPGTGATDIPVERHWLK